MAQGDLVSVACNWGIIPYRHYGIDIGDGTVVHLATVPDDKKRMLVQRVSFEAFSENKSTRVEVIKDALAPEVVVERALSAVGREEYHLVLGNCEHFARGCKCDRYDSHQVDRAMRGIIRLGMLGLVSTTTRAVGTQALTSMALPRVLMGQVAGVSAIIGELARHSSYAVCRVANMEHREAENIGKSLGFAAAAASGMAISGPVGGVAAAAIYVSVDAASSKLFQRVTSKQEGGSSDGATQVGGTEGAISER